MQQISLPTAASQSEVATLGSLLLKRLPDAFVSQEEVDRQWQPLGYAGRPDFARGVAEYQTFSELLRGYDIDLHFLPQSRDTGLDSLYARDASIVCAEGMVLCRMGKPERRGEPEAHAALFEELGIPVHGAITGDGSVEGGDAVWLDERTLVLGRGYRTNDDGIRQLEALLAQCVDEIFVVPLPHSRGPGDVFHLMSILSPVDRDLAVVYSPLMPVTLRERLIDRGMHLVEVPDAEFGTLGCNVLAVAPRKCLMVKGNPRTRARLEAAGAEVRVFSGREICRQGAGGPTCLTRPLSRG